MAFPSHSKVRIPSSSAFASISTCGSGFPREHKTNHNKTNHNKSEQMKPNQKLMNNGQGGGFLPAATYRRQSPGQSRHARPPESPVCVKYEHTRVCFQATLCGYSLVLFSASKKQTFVSFFILCLGSTCFSL